MKLNWRDRNIAIIVLLIGLAMFGIGLILVGQLDPGVGPYDSNTSAAPPWYGMTTIVLLFGSIPVVLLGSLLSKSQSY